jgi:ribosome biogenesis GTPase / thiamine phosphate phosphatase
MRVKESALNLLEQYGWSSDREDDLAAFDGRAFEPARVVEEQRSRYGIQTGAGPVSAVLAGRLRHLVREKEERPAVGDWVVVALSADDGPAVIQGILPRRSALKRKTAGERTFAQVVAANLDTVFVVTSLNHEFNMRRLERFLALVWESGAAPVVLLTKADLCEDVAAHVEEAAASAMGVPVHALSALTGEGVEDLLAYLSPGRTVALVGSSGVGKSTIVNRLAGEEILLVRDIREDDSHGRHTTTHRQLVRLPQGGLIIDTPGMREMGMVEGDVGLKDTFSDVHALASSCRFNDCRHQGEPGCAVQRALDDGTLDADRYRSYRKLEREVAHQSRMGDVRAKIAETRRWKKITMDYRKREQQQGRWR